MWLVIVSIVGSLSWKGVFKDMSLSSLVGMLMPLGAIEVRQLDWLPVTGFATIP